MASLKEIRNRIRSIKNTQQITRAMKMVAAARLRRAQDAVLAARPYAAGMKTMLDAVMARAGHSAHPLLVSRPVQKHELVVLTSDRGLCGGFNANVTRKVQHWMVENDELLDLLEFTTVGRKGNEFLRRRYGEPRHYCEGLLSRLRFEEAEALAKELVGRFLSGETDAVTLVYNELVSAAATRVTMMPLLPLSLPAGEGDDEAYRVDYLYDPDRQALLETLLPRYVANRVWQALLESMASEQAARMAAMESATTNAGDMISSLTLLYNRSRQAAITKELVEVVSGAEALNG